MHDAAEAMEEPLLDGHDYEPHHDGGEEEHPVVDEGAVPHSDQLCFGTDLVGGGCILYEVYQGGTKDAPVSSMKVRAMHRLAHGS